MQSGGKHTLYYYYNTLESSENLNSSTATEGALTPEAYTVTDCDCVSLRRTVEILRTFESIMLRIATVMGCHYSASYPPTATLRPT